MSGLVSGLDTDGLVEQMLSGTQTKIDKQEQQKQQLTWKQEMYRDLIGDINSFGDKFFAYDSATNLTSTSFFDSMLATSNSSAFSVSGTSSASTGATSVVVKQMATNAKGVSKNTVSNQSLTGKLDLDALKNRKVVLEVNGEEVEVNLSEAVKDDGKLDASKVVNLFNSKMTGKGVSASAGEGGTVIFECDDDTEMFVSGKSDALGLAAMGFTSYMSMSGKVESTLSDVKDLSLQVALDGVATTLTVSADTLMSADTDKIKAEINDQLKKAFGFTENDDPMVEASIGNDGAFKLTSRGQGHKIQIGADQYAQGLLGVKSEQSSRISTGVALKDANFDRPLNSGIFEFTINDKKFSFTENDSLYTVMKEVNSSGAGVRMTYSALSDKFTIETTSTGAGDRLRMSQSKGNLLTAMFGEGSFAEATAVKGSNVPISAGTPEAGMTSSVGPGAFKVNVNGVDYSFKLEESLSTKEAVWKINQGLAKQFGYADTADGKKQAISLEYTDGSGFKLNVNNKAAVAFSDDAADSENLAVKMGFTGKMNYTPADDTDVQKADTNFVQKGQNAIVSVNGIETERTSNSFTIEGLNFNLKSVSDAYKGAQRADGYTDADGNFYKAEDVTPSGDGKFHAKDSSGNNIEVTAGTYWVNADSKVINDSEVAEVVTTERDIDKITDGIKSFVEEYNKLVGTINKKVYAEATYKDYAPLTSAQKKEMSEREIELWEEKAHEGLLRRDSDLTTLLSSMRSVFFQRPDGCKYALYDLGFDTVSGYGDQLKTGTLTFDETKFRQMLTADPESVRQLFTGGDVNKEEGLASKLKAAVDSAAKLSSGSAGSLVKLAGMKGYATDKNNTITNQITDINDKIKDLKAKYEKERQRYWNQFNSMEQMIQQMNSQSSWIAQQFSM